MSGCTGPHLLEKRQVYAGGHCARLVNAQRTHVLISVWADCSTNAPGELHLIALDGSGNRMLGTSGHTYEASYSPDGTRLSFVDDALGTRVLKVYSVASMGVVTLGTSVNSAQWTSDGKLLYRQGPSEGAGTLKLFDPGSGGGTTLATDVFGHHLHVSRSRVLFMRQQVGAYGQIWLAQLPSGTPVQLTSGTPWYPMTTVPNSNFMLMLDGVSQNRGTLKRFDVSTGASFTLATGVWEVQILPSVDGLRLTYQTAPSVAHTISINGGASVLLGTDVYANGIPFRFRSDSFLYWSDFLPGYTSVATLKRFDAASGTATFVASNVMIGVTEPGPNGEQPTYVGSSAATNVNEVYAFNHVTGLSQRVANDTGAVLISQIEFNAEQQRQYFYSGGGGSLLFLDVANPTELRSLGEGLFPEFYHLQSPSRLLVVRYAAGETHLEVLGLDGALERRVRAPGLTGTEGGSNGKAVPSNDHALVAFPYENSGLNHALLVFDRATGGSVVLELSQHRISYDEEISWSASGRTLFFGTSGVNAGLWSARFE